MKNIEVKYRLKNLQEIYDFLVALPEVTFVWTREQEDIYFNSPKGRLKLRSEPKNPVQLIFYQRPDAIESRESIYEIYYSDNPSKLITILDNVLGAKVTVKKIRTLLKFRNVRIHLDEVEELGEFMEFESVVDEETNQQLATQNLKEVQSKLAQFKLEPISESYSDLLIKQKTEPFKIR